jgi:hypothetical protein
MPHTRLHRFVYAKLALRLKKACAIPSRHIRRHNATELPLFFCCAATFGGQFLTGRRETFLRLRVVQREIKRTRNAATGRLAP